MTRFFHTEFDRGPRPRARNTNKHEEAARWGSRRFERPRACRRSSRAARARAHIHTDTDHEEAAHGAVEDLKDHGQAVEALERHAKDHLWRRRLAAVGGGGGWRRLAGTPRWRAMGDVDTAHGVPALQLWATRCAAFMRRRLMPCERSAGTASTKIRMTLPELAPSVHVRSNHQAFVNYGRNNSGHSYCLQ